MQIDIDFMGLDLCVCFYKDGEPKGIYAEGAAGCIEHIFTDSTAAMIYAQAWEMHTDPNNEADFRRREFL
jgi:hypothetical protein